MKSPKSQGTEEREVTCIIYKSFFLILLLFVLGDIRLNPVLFYRFPIMYVKNQQSSLWQTVQRLPLLRITLQT